MSQATPLAASPAAVRRFLLEALGLAGETPYARGGAASPSQTLREIRRLECVQLDPVAAVERNQHLVLAARVAGYAPRVLERLLAKHRIFEYWANAACVIPIEDYWMFEGVRRRLRRRLQGERGKLRRAVRIVMKELAAAAPLPSRAIASEDIVHGYWDNKHPKTKATSHALNVLWDTGEVMVVRRDGVERYFDLPHEVVPAEQLRLAEEADPRDADTALLEKYLRAYRVFDLGDFRFGWQKLAAPRRRRMIDRYAAQGAVVPLAIAGVRRPYFILAEDIDRIGRAEREARRGGFPEADIRFLPPLDNLLWRRERLADLFNFTYTWEIYTPAHKRRFGYYTMPVLSGDRLIGRLDPRLDRAQGRLVIRRVHLEPGARTTASLRRHLRHALEGFAAFHGAQSVSVETTPPGFHL